MKILANDGIATSGKKILEEKGFELLTENVKQEELADFINKEGIDTLLVRSATKARKDLIDACPNLKLIGRGGVGMDNIDVKYAESKGIKVFNTPASSSQSVAELVMGHIFTLARFLQDSNRKMPVEGNTNFKALKKAYGKGFELRGRTLGIIGMGRIGRALASYALGIGMKVIYNDHFGHDAEIKMQINGKEVVVNLTASSMEEVLKNADIVSLHVPKIGDEAVIGAKELAVMKQGSILINAARGGVVDENALVDALNSGHLAGAAIDVFENEPTPNEALLKHKNVSLSPHIGAATVEAQGRIGVELAEHIISFFQEVKSV